MKETGKATTWKWNEQNIRSHIYISEMIVHTYSYTQVLPWSRLFFLCETFDMWNCWFATLPLYIPGTTSLQDIVSTAHVFLLIVWTSFLEMFVYNECVYIYSNECNANILNWMWIYSMNARNDKDTTTERPEGRFLFPHAAQPRA